MTFDKEKCCGCAACVNVCPKDAIRWVSNEEGFWEPQIENEKCVDCGLCRKVCPYEENYVGKEADPDIYAAVHKKKEVVKNSSSGGVFTALSDWILQQQGTVYGVMFDENYQVRYGMARTKEECRRFRNSKYVQSNAVDVFPEIVRDLQEGRMVMFTGTPCQVDGLRKYLKAKHVDTKRLYLCDNICHGAASPKVWQSYQKYIRTHILKGKKLQSFSMRSKKEKWQKQLIDCVTECGDESAAINQKASWNKLYLTTYLTRKSCFQCRYTSYKRIGDITLGDYWNIENAGLDIDYSDGVSLVLTNTEKGKEWLQHCFGDLTCEVSNKKACWQIHLEKSSPLSKKRQIFWKEYDKDQEAAMVKYMRGSAFNKITRLISPVLRKMGLYTLAVHILVGVKGHGKQ